MYIYVLTSSAIRTVKLLSRAWLFLTASKAGFILSFASCTTPDFFFFLSFFSWHRGVKREDVRYLGQNMTKQFFRGGGGGRDRGGRASSSTLWPVIGLS